MTMDIEITGPWLRRLADALKKEGLSARVADDEPHGTSRSHRFTFGARAGAEPAEVAFSLHRSVEVVARGLATIVTKASNAKPEEIRVVLFTGRSSVSQLAQPVDKHGVSYEGTFAYLIQTPAKPEPPRRKSRAKKEKR
jgi:hypothetical protein